MIWSRSRPVWRVAHVVEPEHRAQSLGSSLGDRYVVQGEERDEPPELGFPNGGDTVRGATNAEIRRNGPSPGKSKSFVCAAPDPIGKRLGRSPLKQVTFASNASASGLATRPVRSMKDSQTSVAPA